MRVLTCLAVEHNLWIVVLAALMCGLGSIVTVDLFRRAIGTRGSIRVGWLFLTSVCAGSSTWVTHFVAMLGYDAGVPVSYEPVLTVASILIAITGTGLGFAIASVSDRSAATIIGGGLVGLAVAAMHYTGMLAYRVDGIVSWSNAYVVLSLILSSAFSILAVAAVRRSTWHFAPAAALFATIISLHFTGMAAFQVTPLEGVNFGLGTETLQAMALAVLAVGLIIVGTGVSSYLIDDRSRAASTEQLHLMAYQDPLTGLANRRALQDRLEADFAKGRCSTLLLIDLDRFKIVNDNHGHAVGDRLLSQVARRLETLVSADNLTARIGGDELAVVVYEEQAIADEVAAAIVQVIAQPFQIESHLLTIGCSIGLCGTADSNGLEQVMRQADLALYEAKHRGRNRAFRYAPGMREAAVARQKFEDDLTQAVRASQFYLVFQPLVDLATCTPFGYEALIRWQHPTRGLIPPSDFIPLAESNGCIVEIGRWVLVEACRQASQWPDHIHVAVNVSAVQFKSDAFLSHVTQALAASGLRPGRLELELTETAMMTDAARVAQTVATLRTLGVRIAMDDFGTGYSSLTHICALPLDRIKIDRSFVANAQRNANALAVLQAITQLGRAMKIPTLAEGVETWAQVDMLRELGCEAVQGYLMGKPERLTTPIESIAA